MPGKLTQVEGSRLLWWANKMRTTYSLAMSTPVGSKKLNEKRWNAYYVAHNRFADLIASLVDDTGL